MKPVNIQIRYQVSDQDCVKDYFNPYRQSQKQVADCVRIPIYNFIFKQVSFQAWDKVRRT